VGAVEDACGAAAWVVGAAGCVLGSTEATDAAALDGALDATFGDVAGVSRIGGSLELNGETNGGRAARTGADLKPSNTTIAVIVPSVARTARFMAATLGSQFERLAVDAVPGDTAAAQRTHRSLGHRGWSA
jgi:hypothetical protein